MLPTFPRLEPLNSDLYDPFWAAAQDFRLPIHLHLAIGDDPRVRRFIRYVHLRGSNPAMILMNSMGNMEAVARLVFGGVMELFPGLRFVSVEGYIGWVPFFLERADRIYKRHKYWSRLELPMPPSEYFRRQIYATFIEDKVGIRLRHLVGVENAMWSSDYPHSDTTWPHSVRYIEETLAGVPEVDKRKIIGENAAKLYGLT
jgi:predicted TIM-barrel fold metal-dependent hydrolase